MNLKDLKRREIITIVAIIVILIFFTVITISVLDIEAFADTGNNTSGSCQHTFGNWYVGSNKLHARDCTKCGATESNSHAASWGSWTSNYNKHKRTCKVSGCTVSEEHASVDLNNDGICDITGCGLTIGSSSCSHEYSNSFVYCSNNKVSHGRKCTKCGVEYTDQHTFVKSTPNKSTCGYKTTIGGNTYTCGVICSECNGEGKEGGCGTCGCEVYEACNHTFSNSFTNYATTNMHGRVCTKCGITAANPHQFKKGTTINGRCAYSITIGTTTYKCNVVCHECNGAGKTGGCSVCGVTASSGGGDTCTHNRSTQWHYSTRTLTTHTGSCNVCGKTVTSEAHVDSVNSNGVCDYCGVCMSGNHQWKDSTSGNTRYCAQTLCGLVCSHNGLTTGTCSTCGKVLSSSGSTCQHTYGSWYVNSTNNLHARKCTKCDMVESNSHSASWGSWAENTISNRHERNCTVSSCTIKEDHAPVDTNNDGKCDTCGFTMGTSGGDTHTHSFTNNWKEKTDRDHYLYCDDSTCSSIDKSHSAIWGSWTENTVSHIHERFCTVSNCTISDWENEHTSVDADNDGKCDTCGLTVGTSGGGTHTHSFTNNWVINADGKHYLMCDVTGCTQAKQSHAASWTGSSCTANRICAICGVSDGQVLGHDWEAATCVSPKKCKNCNATDGSELGHNWQAATCTNPKTCNRCQATEGSSLGHNWQTATCTEPETCSRCQVTRGTALGHDWQDATCTDPKTCSRCQATEGSELGHDWQDATCTDPETCSRCQEMRGSALGHDWEIATCTKAKTCKRCQATEGTALGHDWQAATCINPKTCSRCQVTEGSKLGHDFTNWTDNRDGTHKGTCSRCQEETIEEHNYDSSNACTKCNAVKQSTTCEHDWQLDKAGASATQHWEKCTKCQEKRNIANHTFKNGVCTVCEYTCKHSSTTVKQDETNHWKECNTCGEKIEKEAHKYENGKCSCGRQEGSTTCAHNWKIDKTGATEKQHWELCTKCQEKRNIEYHTFVNGVCTVCEYACKHSSIAVKEDETYHWKECKNCGATLEKETHKYENGTCSCGKNENVTTPCKHTNREWKADSNYHWQVCKDCGKVLVETTASHVFVNGKCKNCGVAEKSNSSNVKLPNTGGIMKVALITLAISAICGTSYIGFRKYKDIK